MTLNITNSILDYQNTIPSSVEKYQFIGNVNTLLTTTPNVTEDGMVKQKKVLIVYNKFNIDSSMSAVLMLIVGYGNTWETELLNRARSDTHVQISAKYNEIYFMGVEPTTQDITELVNDNNSIKITVFSYGDPIDHKGSLLLTDMVNNGKLIESYTNEGERKVEDKHTISSLVATQYMQDDSFAFTGHDIKMYRTYIGAILKYIEFMPMTMAETIFLHSNMNVVKNVLVDKFSNAPMALNTGTSTEREREYSAYVQESRDLIKSNWRQCHYAGANGSSFITPTVSVTEKDSLHVMRMMNYAHPDVISYEDKRNCRVYRILSSNAANWYIKRFEPIDVWKEGSLVYLTTELNKHVS